MRFHWYWPFARSEELSWATATARRDDTIVVQVIDREVAPQAGTCDRVTVVRDLPDVDRTQSNSIQWALSRASTYRVRAQRRRQHWSNDSFDLVHLHYVNRFSDAIVRLPRPLVMSVHDVLPHVARLGATGERHLLRRLYGRADALVVHHDRLRKRILTEFDIDPEAIHVVPHQVFPVSTPPSGRPDGTPVVLFFGALRANKGIELLPELMQRLGADDLRLVVAGRGDPALERLVGALAHDDKRVTAEIGFATLERKRELFEQASLVVLPYTSFESQSGVLHDAYGHGRPVVVTDVGALGESVREDATGLVVPLNDPVSLANAVREALQEPAWNSMSVAGLVAADIRSPAAVGKRLREVYDVVLAKT